MHHPRTGHNEQRTWLSRGQCYATLPATALGALVSSLQAPNRTRFVSLLINQFQVGLVVVIGEYAYQRKHSVTSPTGNPFLRHGGHICRMTRLLTLESGDDEGDGLLLLRGIDAVT